MKRDHSKNLRYSQKIKETECFIQADSLLKKIRKFDAGTLNNVDADIKMRQIEYFWKQNWQYDHTHHTFMQPRMTTPCFYIQKPGNCNQMLNGYYQLLRKFVNKLKIQHQDQTIYRISIVEYPFIYEQQTYQDRPCHYAAKLGLQHLIQLFTKLTAKMLQQFQQSKRQTGELMLQDLDSTCISSLQFVNNICTLVNSFSINQEIPESQNSMQVQLAYFETIKFMSFITQKWLQIGQKTMAAEVICVQPYLGQLTYIMHPLCYCFYSLFSHEKLIRLAKKKRGKVYADEQDKPLQLVYEDLNYGDQLLHITDNLKIQEYRHSKIILLNLDGYESQFNLEFLRNFSEHVMYISFPKFQSNINDQPYNSRFYKKIMFHYTKSELGLFANQQDDQGLTQTLRRQELLENPEGYHKAVNQLYFSNESDDQMDDFNKNLFVFPLNINAINPKKYGPKQSQIEGSESYFIRYLFRNHLFASMLKFKPKMILISYSGKIKIENEHFLQLIQELSRMCPRLMFFPNFTTTLIRQKMSYYFDHFQSMPAYDKVFSDIGSYVITPPNLSPLEERLANHYKQIDINPHQIDFLDKLSIFMKVSAGHYNLNRAFEEEKLQIKLKNCKVFDYAINLYGVLKNEYQHCKKRMEPYSLKAAKTVLGKGIQQYSKQLDECVPIYYKKMFQYIDKLLFGKELNQQENLRMRAYELQLLQLREKFGTQGLLGQQWNQLKRIEALAAANNKYQETAYLQIHTVTPKQEFTSLKGDRMDNMDNIYKISFCDRQRNTQIIKIYKEASLHYKPYQKFRLHNHYFNVILTNMLNLEQNSYQNYTARPKIGNKRLQRCQITPIQFIDKTGTPVSLLPFMNFTEWSYTQTQSYLILYWPQVFDHVAHYLHCLLNRTYHKCVQNRIFVCSKNNDLSGRVDKVRFFEVNMAEGFQSVPRWGCSAFFIQDQIFIFGGFHQAEKSYLDLQNQITTIDLNQFKNDPSQPRKIFNLRKELYCGQAFQGHLREKRRPSSFVRPRTEFEFYDFDDLNLDQAQIQEQGFIKIVMIGGYGQDFKTPYSLFVNYYYIITFDVANQRIFSIQKRNVQKKVIPVNVKGAIKNRGVFNKANILDQRETAQPEERKCRQGITNNNHYFSHRVLYAIKDGQLQSKVKNIYALEVFQNCKKQYRNFAEMIGEVRAVEQGEIVSIKKLEKTNHHLLVQINESLYLYSLFLQMRSEQSEEIPLTNQSIISLDTKKFNIYALVYHLKHTNKQTYLATETLVEPSPSLIKQRNHCALVLKQLCSFPHSLHLHCLIVCNANEVVLLQGIALRENKIPEYLVKVKSKTMNDIKRQQIMPTFLNLDQEETLFTFFYKKNNLISTINFVRSSNRQEFIMIRQSLDLQKFTEGWKDVGGNRRFVFVHRGLPIKIESIQVRLQNYGFDNLVLRLFPERRQGCRGFLFKLNRIAEQSRQIQVTEISGDEQLRLNSQQLLPFVVKTQAKYLDYQYSSEEL